MTHIFLTAFLFFGFLNQACAFEFQDSKRTNITMVGSSTVYPFASTLAEKFKGNNDSFRTPIVEATGTGGGFKLFCGGVGYKYPDFVNASRPIEPSEIKKCSENGVKDPVEIKIGYDGIVLANSVAGKKFLLTKEQIFLALADKVPSHGKLVQNPHKKWSDINVALPAFEIAIYGPPSTSGTRDSFAELLMENVCNEMKEFIAAYPDKNQRKKQCKIIRSDGKFIEAGENDNLILQKLKNDRHAFGIFGFSFLRENKNNIQPVAIDGVDPSLESIVLKQYLLSRPLFIYAKKEHIDLVPGMREFVKEIISQKAIAMKTLSRSNAGYLVKKGLIPMPDNEMKQVVGETKIKLGL